MREMCVLISSTSFVWNVVCFDFLYIFCLKRSVFWFPLQLLLET